MYAISTNATTTNIFKASRSAALTKIYSAASGTGWTTQTVLFGQGDAAEWHIVSQGGNGNVKALPAAGDVAEVVVFERELTESTVPKLSEAVDTLRRKWGML